MDHPLKAYWRLYGGANALLNSPYLFWSAILTILCWPMWAHSGRPDWADISINVMPSLMGFSVAGMTVLLAFSDSKSLRAITQHGRYDSYFVKTVANLFHFLLVQMIALLLAIVARAHPDWTIPFPGYAFFFLGSWSLIYAIFVSIAAAGQLLNTAIVINKAVWTGTSTKPDARPDTQPLPDTEAETPP